jgi:hypothetical protein
MNVGEIYFDMTVEDHPIISGSKFLLKRWTKQTIYSKSGSYNRTDNPIENLYVTGSVYLYDYVVVSKDWFDSMVYTASFDSNVPGSVGNYSPSNLWTHNINTFKTSPNLLTNNYQLTASKPETAPSKFDYDLYSQIDDGTYFEIVMGYPRNHYTHKRGLFSLYNITTYGLVNKVVTYGTYLRNRQTTSTTVGPDGLEDGSSPIQATQVGNLNLVQTDNVINH